MEIKKIVSQNFPSANYPPSFFRLTKALPRSDYSKKVFFVLVSKFLYKETRVTYKF